MAPLPQTNLAVGSEFTPGRNHRPMVGVFADMPPTHAAGRAPLPRLATTFALSAALAALLTACAALPGASAPPTAAPPTEVPASPEPTPPPPPTPTPSPSFGGDQIEHPTGATDVVLRMETGGGFVPIDFLLTQAPQFTLYGDGTVVFEAAADPNRFGPGGPLTPFQTGRMTEEGMQALLSYALSTGRLAGARDSYIDMMIADAPTTTFTLNAGGLDKVVSVYALGMAQPGDPDAVDKSGFAQLADVLNNFERQAQSGTLDEIKPYDANLYKATMLDQAPGGPGQAVDWPWEDLTLADFPTGDEPGRVKVLTRDQVALLTDVPNGGQTGIPVNTPDGESVVSFGLRPLLPDEEAAYLNS